MRGSRLDTAARNTGWYALRLTVVIVVDVGVIRFLIERRRAAERMRV
jgi:hypothetical protein